MRHSVLLLGLGAQGRAALHDLVTTDDETHVSVADADPSIVRHLERFPRDRVSAHHLDAADEQATAQLMRGADVVIEALPGPLAFPMGKLAGACGVSLVSSMYYRDPQEQDARTSAGTEAAIRELDAQAKAKGLVILTEFGVDPGLDLILGATALAELDEVHEFHAYGAGIPAPGARNNPLMYKFSWSPIGVLRSYRRPARIISGGKVVDIEPTRLFEPGRYHLLDVDGIGAPLECYPNGDAVHYAALFGIRDTVREMARYTGRLPGHCAFWNVMVKSGFLDSTPLSIGDARISPMSATAAVLTSQSQFQYGDDEADMTFIRVDVRGTRGTRRRDAERVRVIYDLVDTRDFTTGLTSMQRTVGFTLAHGARLILAGALDQRGLLTPLDVPYASVFPALERHGIHVQRRELAW